MRATTPCRGVIAVMCVALVMACSSPSGQVTASPEGEYVPIDTNSAFPDRYLSEVRSDPNISQAVGQDFTDNRLLELGELACQAMDDADDAEQLTDEIRTLARVAGLTGSDAPEEDYTDMVLIHLHAAWELCPRHRQMFKDAYLNDDS